MDTTCTSGLMEIFQVNPVFFSILLLVVPEENIAGEVAQVFWFPSHTTSASKQSNAVEAVQRQACQIIIGSSKYCENHRVLDMDSLNTRRQHQTKKHLTILSTTLNIVFSACYLLNAVNLSLVVFGVLTDCRVYLRRLTDLGTLLFAFVYRIFRLNECVLV